MAANMFYLVLYITFESTKKVIEYFGDAFSCICMKSEYIWMLDNEIKPIVSFKMKRNKHQEYNFNV